MKKKLVVFHFHNDLENLMGENEHDVLLQLHYRAAGNITPVDLGKGNNIDVYKGTTKFPPRHPSRIYSQTWMNKFFIIADIDMDNWVKQLGSMRSYWGPEDKIKDRVTRCIETWVNMEPGTRLFIPNPYYQFIADHVNQTKWLIGGPERAKLMKLFDSFGLMYSHIFMSRMWLPVGNHGSNPSELTIHNSGNMWTPSFNYYDRKLNKLRPQLNAKLGTGGFSVISQGIDTIMHNPLDGMNGLFSPRYLLDSEEPRLLSPIDFQSLNHIKKHGGVQIKHSQRVVSDQYRFALPTNQNVSSLVYDGLFTIEYDTTINSSTTILDTSSNPDSPDLQITNNNVILIDNPAESHIITIKDNESNGVKSVHLMDINAARTEQSTVSNELYRWLNGTQTHHQSIFPRQDFRNENMYSRIFNNPVYIGKSPLTNSVQLPDFIPNQSLESDTITVRTKFKSTFPHMLP